MCNAGTVQGLSGQAACTACPVGSYMAFSGQTACVSCAVGSYQSMSGQTTCVLCDAGFTTSGPGATNSGACSTCCIACVASPPLPASLSLPRSLCSRARAVFAIVRLSTYSPWRPRFPPVHVCSMFMVVIDVPTTSPSSTGSAGVTCVAGQYKAGETCYDCSLGTYSMSTNAAFWYARQG